jgi:hypothetical protein
MFSGYGCAGLCGPRARWEEEEIGRAVSIHSEKVESGLGAAAGVSGVDSLPWSWKECTLLRVYEAYEFCLTIRAPRTEKLPERGPSEGGFEGIEKVFAAVGLGGAAQPQQGRRGKLSQDLFEGPKEEAPPSRGSSVANGHGNGHDVVAPLPEAVVRETTVVEGGKNAPLKNLPYPFPGFGPRESSEQEQVPFPPSPAMPDEGVEGENDDEEEDEGVVEGDIVVEGEEEEEGDFQPRSSEEPSSFSGRASNSLSSLGQPIPSRYPFAFRHPARGGSMSSTGSPPFAFSRTVATPQSKSTSTRGSHDTRSTGNVETASSSPEAGSPVSVAPPSSSAHSPQDQVRGMPMPPRHPAAGAGGRQRPNTAPGPASPTPGGLSATRPRQTFEQPRHLRPDSGASDELLESEREDDRASRSGQPSPDGSLEAREREDSVGLLSPHSSQPSPRASLLGSRNGSATSLARISGAFRPRSRSRNTSSGSGTGSASSRHNSHVSVSSASLALGRARAHSLIHSIGGASRSSIELVLGRVGQPGSPATRAMRLGDSSDADGSEGALTNPESHTFGLPPIVGGPSMLPRRAGARARTLDSDASRSSVSSSSAAAVTSARARAAMVREQLLTPDARGSSRTRSASSLSPERERERERERAQRLQTARSFASQDSQRQQQEQQEQPPSPSVMTQSVRSEEDTTSVSTRTQTQAMMSQAPSQAQTRAHTPAGVPIPSSPSHPPPPPADTTPSPQQPADVSTAPASLVTMPQTVVSQTTDSLGGRTPGSFYDGAEHYAPPHARGFVPH